MKIYFLSSRPCALTLNGAFFGVTDTFERYAEISLSDNIYAQFCPQSGLPIGCFLTENLRCSPPDGCEVYLLKDGIALYARDFPPSDFTLHPIAQAKENGVLATLFRQGVVQLTVESEDGLYTAALPDDFQTATLSFHSGLVFVETENRLAVYSKKGERLLTEQVLSYAVEENILRASLPLSDSFCRTAECAWELTETACTRTEFTLCQGSTSPQEGLLAYAFFESVLIGADYEALLCDELRDNATQIVEFLGNFTAVTLTREPNCCGLVKPLGERLFSVAYFRVETEKGKIIDVKG